jgi:hypothetical protein
MAAASGLPQDPPTKKGFTPEQKKKYAALGALGLLVLVGGGAFLVPRLTGSSSDTAPVTSTASSNVATAPGALSPDGTASGSADPFAAGGATGGGATGGAKTSAVSAPLARSRPDPFEQAYLIPTPPPPVPPPVSVPLPSDMMPVSLPGGNFRSEDMSRPLVLPPVKIDRLDETARRPIDAFPPRRSAEGGSGSVAPSFDKRLSGVVIGDGVRALLEIQGPNGPVTRNVQPGDEVDGITVLNIQRFQEGGRTVTRMLIRENGEERSVELRPSPQPMTGAAGFPGGSGFPGGPGMPGAPPMSAPGPFRGG